MLKQFYHCGLTIVGTHLQPKMVWSPLIATQQVYRLLQAVTSRFMALWQKYSVFVTLLGPWSPSLMALSAIGTLISSFSSTALLKILLLGAPTLKCCSQMDCIKGTHNNGKDLLTNRKDPWAETKDFKGLSLKNQFPRT